MATSTDAKTPIDYVLTRHRDLPEAEQTRWKLRRLSKRELACVYDQVNRGIGTKRGAEITYTSHDAETMLEVARIGILEVENWFDDDGNPLTLQFEAKLRLMFGRQVKPVTEESLEPLDLNDQVELAGVIMTGSEVTEKDVGN